VIADGPTRALSTKQVFSLAHGNASNECIAKGRRRRRHNKELKSARPMTKRDTTWRADVTGPNAVKISEGGVTFRSYRDGSRFLLTPESTIRAQKSLGADIILPLDE